MTQKAEKTEMTTINFRLEKSLKEETEKLFAAMGISMSTALKMFLAQSVLEGRMPFCPGEIRGGCRTVSNQEAIATEAEGWSPIDRKNDLDNKLGNEAQAEQKNSRNNRNSYRPNVNGDVISEQGSVELSKIINDRRNETVNPGVKGVHGKTKTSKQSLKHLDRSAVSAEAVLDELSRLVGDDVRVRTIEIEEIIDE